MALISDVLNLIRLSVDVYHNARVCGDWRINEHSVGATCFHMPTQGDCLLSVPGEGDWHLRQGDVVIFPKELPHIMVPSGDQSGPQQHLPIAESQAIQGTSMLCGAIEFQHSGGEQLMQLLPKVLVVNAEDAKHWLGPLAQLIVAESLEDSSVQNPVLNRLCELLVVYALRCYAGSKTHENSIFALYAHPKLFKAVKAIHQNPAHNWQLGSLAKEAAMSRTRFSELFGQVAGMTATHYLTWWRMQVAWSELQEGHSVELVASHVGYQSEAAFARVFKKTFGMTVGAVRAQGQRKVMNSGILAEQ